MMYLWGVDEQIYIKKMKDKKQTKNSISLIYPNIMVIKNIF